MTIDEMKKRKQETGYTCRQISELSGVPYGTVQKIFTGETASPRHDTVVALTRLFEKYRDIPDDPANVNCVRESAPYGYDISGKQGTYTVDDLYSFGDEKRRELIDGVMFEMQAPQTVHQVIASYISNTLFNHAGRMHGECIVLQAPLDVQPDSDDRTMVEPDVMVLCDRKKLLKDRIFGAPDLIVEILSKATRYRDMAVKLKKYAEAQVREYWIVDADKRRVFVYDFASECYPAIYGFDAEVPVAIWDGSCKVDFSKLTGQIEKLL